MDDLKWADELTTDKGSRTHPESGSGNSISNRGSSKAFSRFDKQLGNSEGLRSLKVIFRSAVLT